MAMKFSYVTIVANKQNEGDLLGAFFFRIYEFLFILPNMSPRAFVPADLPARYAIGFVPAVSAFNPAFPPSVSYTPSTDHSVVSSANFVVPVVPVSPPSCIGPSH